MRLAFLWREWILIIFEYVALMRSWSMTKVGEKGCRIPFKHTITYPRVVNFVLETFNTISKISRIYSGKSHRKLDEMDSEFLNWMVILNKDEAEKGNSCLIWDIWKWFESLDGDLRRLGKIEILLSPYFLKCFSYTECHSGGKMDVRNKWYIISVNRKILDVS